MLQVDGYAAYRGLLDPRRNDRSAALAYCWSHVRRKFYEIAKAGDAPIADEALRRIAALYAVEAEIRGQDADARRAARDARSRPIVEDLRPWLEAQLARLPGRSRLAEAIRYALKLWDGLGRFLDDGRLEIDTNTVERAIRPIAGAESLSPLIQLSGNIGRWCQRRRESRPRGGAKPGQWLGAERHGPRARHLAGVGHGALARRANPAAADQALASAFRARLCPSR